MSSHYTQNDRGLIVDLNELIKDPVVQKVHYLVSKVKDQLTNFAEIEILEFLLLGYSLESSHELNIEYRLELLTDCNTILNSLYVVEDMHRYIESNPESRWVVNIELLEARPNLEHFDRIISYNLAKFTAIKRFLSECVGFTTLTSKVEEAFNTCDELYRQISTGIYKGDSLTSPWALRNRRANFINCQVNP